MTTLSELVTNVSNALHSYTGLHEQMTWLTADCNEENTTLSVAGSDQVLRGIAEVGDELIYVHATDANTLSLAPFGRGYRGTTATSHPAETPVVFDPLFPRANLITAIKALVKSLYPNLYQVKTVDFTNDPLVIGHPLPDDCDKVLNVSVQLTSDPADYWSPLHRWSFDTNGVDGNLLNLYGSLSPGTQVRVVYQAPFGELTGDFADAGIPESYEDLLVYGVAARMLRFMDVSRLQVNSVENATRSQFVQTGDAGRVANQLFALYTQRVAEERKRLLDLTPPSYNYLPR